MELSPAVGLSWQLAAGEALLAEEEFIEPDHLFLGCLKLASVHENTGPTLHALRQDARKAFEILDGEIRGSLNDLSGAAVKFDPLRYKLRELRGKGRFRRTRGEGPVHRSEASLRIFHNARQSAERQKSFRLRWHHLLLALLRESPDEERAQRFKALWEFQIDVPQLRGVLSNPESYTPEAPESYSNPSAAREPEEERKEEIEADKPEGELGKGEAPANGPVAPHTAGSTHFLESYGRDLTELARSGLICEPIGRRAEMLRVVRTLARQTKSNPVLVGEAGVGKTAIVEGLACRVAQGRVPRGLQRRQAVRRIVQLDMTALAAGTRYRGDFEERLRGVLKEARESHDTVIFIDELDIVVGAGRPGGVAVDAAGILKPALARGEIRVIGATSLDDYRRYIEKDAALERRFQPIQVREPDQAETRAILQRIRGRLVEHHGVEIAEEAIQAALDLSARYIPDRYWPDKAIDLLDEACASIAVQWTSTLEGEDKEASAAGIVTAETVATVVSRNTGIPVTTLKADERRDLLNMAGELKRRIIGQDHACNAVAQAVMRARAGLKPLRRPIAVLLFLGPTGVGKTELAKATAAILFGDERALLRLDLAEYQKKHTVSRLIGAPPGYVGHDEEGQLTGPLRRTPRCVVLLDEMEKAHPDVLNLFLHVFDDGRLTDASGRESDASNALFMLTSNLAYEDKTSVGFRVRGEGARRVLAQQGMRPELINRLDEIVVFSPLTRDDAKNIAQLQLVELRSRLEAQKVHLEWSDEALDCLVDAGFSQEFGARELRRVIAQRVENEIAAMLVRDQVKAGQALQIDAKDSTLLFTSGGVPKAD